MITVHVARAIAFIHAQSPPSEKNMKMNVHGNIKPSNVMINIDLTARLSDYCFVQLAACAECPDKDRPGTGYCENLSQKSEIFNFGPVLLGMLAGVREPGYIKYILDTMESIKQGTSIFFEFHVQGKERKQALKVLDIVLACTNRLLEARPSIEQILLNLSDIFKKPILRGDIPDLEKKTNIPRTEKGAYKLDLYLSRKHDELLARTLKLEAIRRPYLWSLLMVLQSKSQKLSQLRLNSFKKRKELEVLKNHQSEVIK
ncbi:probable inactive receptor kinase At5g16590 [Durio zibethinus]|uniref:Probable inactive receptor kinase At5g16590 n=1 Tax=Durio zibethinus TaxID=66656 RepID=A0A6P5ZMM8_DURZI|nr:probable inactive receptor kinase At5g16590 [Durio zibethinus]